MGSARTQPDLLSGLEPQQPVAPQVGDRVAILIGREMGENGTVAVTDPVTGWLYVTLDCDHDSEECRGYQHGPYLIRELRVERVARAHGARRDPGCGWTQSGRARST